MLYVQLIVFGAIVVLFVATVLHEAILSNTQGAGRESGSDRNLTSFSLCCVIAAMAICLAGWILNL